MKTGSPLQYKHLTQVQLHGAILKWESTSSRAPKFLMRVTVYCSPDKVNNKTFHLFGDRQRPRDAEGIVSSTEAGPVIICCER